MSIDEIGRAAAAEARQNVVAQVDTVARLRQMHRSRRTRNLSSVVAVVVVVASLVVGGQALLGQRGSGKAVGPAGSQRPPHGAACSDLRITCMGTDRYRVALSVPVTVTVPVNFSPEFEIWNAQSFEAYRTDVDSTGVTVFENAVAVKNDARWTADPSAGTTARAMAEWLLHRPFLMGGRITAVQVGGLKGWQVTATLRRGATLAAYKNGSEAAPTFKSAFVTAAFTPTLTGDYTLVDVPHAGVVVIWSWTSGHEAAATQDSRPLVDALRFG